MFKKKDEDTERQSCMLLSHLSGKTVCVHYRVRKRNPVWGNNWVFEVSACQESKMQVGWSQAQVKGDQVWLNWGVGVYTRLEEQQLAERKVRKAGCRWFLCVQEELWYVESAALSLPWETTDLQLCLLSAEMWNSQGLRHIQVILGVKIVQVRKRRPWFSVQITKSVFCSLIYDPCS